MPAMAAMGRLRRRSSAAALCALICSGAAPALTDNTGRLARVFALSLRSIGESAAFQVPLAVSPCVLSAAVLCEESQHETRTFCWHASDSLCVDAWRKGQAPSQNLVCLVQLPSTPLEHPHRSKRTMSAGPQFERLMLESLHFFMAYIGASSKHRHPWAGGCDRRTGATFGRP